MANYPTGLPVFDPKTNLEDTVNAPDINDAYTEILAIAQTAGLTPQTRAANWGVGNFDTTVLNYNTIGARVQNVENAAYITYNDYVSKSGGTTITSLANDTTSLIIKAKSGQTAPLLDVKNASNTTLVSVSSAGTLTAVLIDGGSA